MNNVQPIDWSATAAWIALAISITGTIVGPIVTTILTNRHQLKLRKLDIKEKSNSEYLNNRRNAIENFLSNTSRYLVDEHVSNMDNCGKHYFQVYAYAPTDLWDSLDELYKKIVDEDTDQAKQLFLIIARRLTESLAETLQQPQ